MMRNGKELGLVIATPMMVVVVRFAKSGNSLLVAKMILQLRMTRNVVDKVLVVAVTADTLIAAADRRIVVGRHTVDVAAAVDGGAEFRIHTLVACTKVIVTHQSSHPCPNFTYASGLV